MHISTLSKSIVCSIMLFVCIGTSSQIQSYSLDFTLSKKNFADTIPVRFEDGRLLVPVIIRGQKYSFLLDTGASHAVMYDDTMIEGCIPVGEIPSYDANGRKDTVRVVRIPTLTIGMLSLQNYRATVQHRKIKEKNIDGILGFDLVNKGLLMKIDVHKGHLILTDTKRHFDSDNGINIRYRQNHHVPYIKVMPFKNYREWVRFDTGSRRFYSINRKSYAENEHKMLDRKQIEGRSRGSVSIGYSGVELMDEVVFLALDDFQTAGCSFSDLHVITTQGNSHMGTAVLKYGSVTFNPFKKYIRFQPYNGITRFKVSNPQREKAIVPDNNGRPMIGLVWEKSELYKVGFRVGDIILAVDGQAIYSIDDYNRKFQPIRNYKHTFTLKDVKGHLKELKAIWLR